MASPELVRKALGILGHPEREGWARVEGIDGQLGVRGGFLEHVALEEASTASLSRLPDEGEADFWYRQALLGSTLFREYLRRLLALPKGKMHFTSAPVAPGMGFRLSPEAVDAFLSAVSPAQEGGGTQEEGWEEWEEWGTWEG